jgi:general secretion pathway protein G
MKRNARGFTLVEILIVVIILGILAAIVIPKFANASLEAQTANLHSQLQTVRAAIELYRVQHRDVPPDLVGSNWAAFTGKTDSLGNASVNPDDWGPYIQNEPKNPLANSNSISDTASPGVGWVYDKTSGTITATSDNQGTLFDESSN